MAIRPQKWARSSRGRWAVFGILAVLLTAIAVGIALNLPVRPRSIGAPLVTPKPVAPMPAQRAVNLGSYGVTITDHAGQIHVLTIHPVAILRGDGPWKSLLPLQGQLDARIANPFMAFPDLVGITDSTSARAALEQQIQRNIAPLLNGAESGWKIIGIELHPVLRPPPPEIQGKANGAQ